MPPTFLRLFDGAAAPVDPVPRRSHKLPGFLRWPDALNLLDWCDAQVSCVSPRMLAAAKRDAIIFRVGLYLGLRCAEITKLDVTDVDLENRTVKVREGKGRKDRLVRIPEKLIPYLNDQIGRRTEGTLILSKRGGRCPHRTISWRLARAARLAGLKVHVHPHSLRHTYATHFLEMGGNIRSLQALLGHSDLSTTAIYLDLDTTRFAEDVDRL